MVEIIYDLHYLGTENSLKRAFKEVSEKYEVPIDIVLSEWTLLEDLRNHPNCDLVVIHVGRDNGNVYRQAKHCKELSKARVIAESSIFPAGRHEILQNFDYYIGPLVDPQYVEKLLREYKFIRS